MCAALNQSAETLLRSTITPFLVALMIGILPPARVLAQGTVHEWDDPNSSRTTRLWLPGDVDTIRGILIVGNGAGGGDSRFEATQARNQRFAEQFGFAVIGTANWGAFTGGTAEINVWNQQLTDLAATTGHGELVHAPWAPIGLSNGGQMSYGFNFHHPEKTIAFIANKGQVYAGSFPPSGHAGLKNPGILIAGENDTTPRRDMIRNIFLNNRPRPANWAWVEQENIGHSRLANEIVFPFMAEAIRLRYPANQTPTATSGVTLATLTESSGWLADNASWTSGMTQVASFNDYAGNKGTASWLMNENMAHLYRAFSTYNKVVDFDLPGSTEVLYSHDNVVSFGDPLAIELVVNTEDASDWTLVELYNYGEKIAELTNDGSPLDEAVFDVVLPGAGVYGLSALVTHSGGVDTTGVKAFVAIPEPVSVALLAAGALLLLRRRP